MGEISGIDHVVIATRDLDRARDAYERLGFTVTPRGHHTVLGSSNHCMMLAGRDYLELLQPGSGGTRPFVEQFLKRHEGVAGIAIRTNDARAVHAAWERAGLKPNPPIAFGRPVDLPGDLPGGQREARFLTTEVDPERTPETRLFACQHLTPELVWHPSYLAHSNGATGLAEIVLMAADPAAAAAAYAPVFGATPRTDPDGAVVATGGVPLRFLNPAAAARRYSGDPALMAAPPVVALVLRTADPGATADFFAKAGIGYERRPTGGLVIAAAAAVGVILEFVPTAGGRA